MDSPEPLNDEVIADSEGEMDEEDYQGILSASANIANIASQISASALPGQLHGNSSISSFTAGPRSLNMGDQHFSEIENFLDTASIADRAKTRQRNPKSSIQSSFTKSIEMDSSAGRLEKRKVNGNISSDIIELTSDEDDDELNLRPPKLKPKVKPKPTVKVKHKPRDTSTSNDKTLDIPGTTETNTVNSPHAIPDSRPRPRPRPRPLVKRSIPAQESTGSPPLLPPDIPGRGLLSSSASGSHGPELPIASPVRPDLHTSQLPPSNPPLPTLTNVYDENVLPPIETLPNHDFDEPLSSPSSLFSDLGGTTKKRKRTVFNLEIDELASDADLGPGKGIAPQVPPHLLPPPPTFFAGSSSSSIGGGDGRLPPQVPSDLARDIVDLTMLPPTIQSISSPTKKTATKKVKTTKKAKISRQKKDDATRMDEDGVDDDDFHPTEPTSKKRNSKPKGKVMKSTAKTSKTDEKISSQKDDATRMDEDEVDDDFHPIESASKKGNPKPKASKADKKISRQNKDDATRMDEDDVDDDDDDLHLTESTTKKRNSKPKENITKSTSTKASKTDERLNTEKTSTKKKDDAFRMDEDEVDDDFHLTESTQKRNLKPKESVMKSTTKASKTDERPNTEKISSQKKDDTFRMDEDEVDDDFQPTESTTEKGKSKPKENVMKSTSKASKTVDRPNNESPALFPSLHSRYEIAPRRSSLPMSELIRRANSALGSPLSTPQPRASSSSATRSIKSSTPISTTTYSPCLKSSRSVLSRIAPLHPNRRTPPPPLPPPPPKKKTKKELELEEKWEEEMIDSVGGISEWTCLADDEKKELRKAKWAREMGDWDD